MNNHITLSICLPTYNRANYLNKLLNIIKQQVFPNVEIVISNNASIDNTQIVIEQFIKNNAHIKIVQINQPTNIGFDKNVLSVIMAASGDYCWLVSDDDTILPDAINNILNLINSKPETSLFVTNYSRFDAKQNKITAKTMMNLPTDIALNDCNKFYFIPTPKSYFYILGTNMITMSANIFKRSLWIEASQNTQQFIGLNFIHIFILTKIMSRHPSLYFISKPQVQYLCNNHRQWNNDIWNDYKKYYLQHLKDIGFDKNNIDHIIKSKINRTTTKDKIYKVILKIMQYLNIKPIIKK